MLNRIQLIGNVGCAPEIKKMQDGNEVATFSLATHSSWKGEDGGWNKKTEWHTVVVYREIFIARIKETLKKGEAVFVEGKLSYAEWEDKHTHQKRRTAHIVISEKGGQVEVLRSEKFDFGHKVRGEKEQNGGCFGKYVLQTDSQVVDLGVSPIESLDSENPSQNNSYNNPENSHE